MDTKFSSKVDYTHIEKWVYTRVDREYGENLLWFDSFSALEFTGQVTNEFLINERINIFAKKEKDKPVTNLAFIRDHIHLVNRRHGSP